METTRSARTRSSRVSRIVLAALLTLAVVQPLAAADDRRSAFHVDRDTALDRATVSFLKSLVKTDRERLVVLGPDGQVLASSEGTRNEVDVPYFDSSLVSEGEGVVLVHSHPSSTSFSRADLLHLSRPGVEAVVAIGDDGSVYFAARGPRFVVNRVGPLYDSASSGAQDVWRSSGNWQGGPHVSPAPHFAHIVCHGLAGAGVIVYRASVPFDRERSYFDGTILFALMTEAASSDAREALGQ
jgi:proteasome lid subunit RPN8/RPN11